MSGNQFRANQYKQTAVQTANRGQILIMLYEAAVKNVKKASECLASGDIAGKGTHIGKAHDIINELNATLDFNIGGDIARDLERLYNFMSEQLVTANMENNATTLETVQKLLETLLGGWKVAVEQAQKENKI